MTPGIRNIRVCLSQQCFNLLADAMCAYSKRTGRFQTIRTTVQAACEGIGSKDVSREDVETFFSEYSVDGDVAVWLEIRPAWAAQYDSLREQVKKFSGKQGADKIMVPLTVFIATRENLI